MRKGSSIILVLVLSALVLSGCMSPQQPRAVEVPVQYKEATLIEGQTTKTELLQIFGNPDDFGTNSLGYLYRNRSPLIGAKIRYVQKDGTEFGIILRRGTAKEDATFYLDDNGVLKSAHFY